MNSFYFTGRPPLEKRNPPPEEVTPEDLSAFLIAMTQDELDQGHDIFMITVNKGQSDIKSTQGLTPEEISAWTAEELEEFKQLILAENADVQEHDSSNELEKYANAESTTIMTWEKVEPDVQQQESATYEWETAEE